MARTNQANVGADAGRRWQVIGRDELIVDNFAGGGGASLGIEWALGRSPDVAVNHDREAIAMHRANHPRTTHYECDVFEVDPRIATRSRRVGLAWFSPDCTHHSKAKGGKPMRPAGRKSRGLASVVVRWAESVHPRVIILENVEEFQDWGPVVRKVGEDGEPVFDPATGEPWYVPCPDRKGRMFRQWVRSLERAGYVVEWRELRACDYGAPTIRKRLFVIARCDGRPIVWPEATHAERSHDGSVPSGMVPWLTAADIIDWSLACPSIFLDADTAKRMGLKRPLAKATLRRIASGVKRYVIDAHEPFIVCANHGGDCFRGQSLRDPFATVTTSRDAHGLCVPFGSYAQHGGRNRSVDQPLHTVTASTKDYNGIVFPMLSAYYGDKGAHPQKCSELSQPLKTQTTENRHALVAAFLAQHNRGVIGHAAQEPVSTLTARCTQQQIVGVSLNQLYTSNTNGGDGDPRRPMKTVTAGGNHAGLVAALMAPYYGSGSGECGRDLREPSPTVTTKDRFQLVTVTLGGELFVLEDIGMRMLTPRELFRAQGFPDSYVIDPLVSNRLRCDGRPMKAGRLPKHCQVRMCGNSVCPPLAAAIVRANLSPMGAADRRQREFALKS